MASYSTLKFELPPREELELELAKLQRNFKRPEKPDDEAFLRPLDDLARKFPAREIGRHGLKNAKELARGFRDLVVVLLEPTWSSTCDPFDAMVESSATLCYVDDVLKRSTGGLRTLRNTRVFDIRPFRTRPWRIRQSAAAQSRDDEIAYHAFEEMMRIAKPDVVLVCHCSTASAGVEIVKTLSSATKKAGSVSAVDLLGNPTIVVWAFHPGYFQGNERRKIEAIENGDTTWKPTSSHYGKLLELAFLVAINAAIGCYITGDGRLDLFLAAKGNQYIVYQKRAKATPAPRRDSAVSVDLATSLANLAATLTNLTVEDGTADVDPEVAKLLVKLAMKDPSLAVKPPAKPLSKADMEEESRGADTRTAQLTPPRQTRAATAQPRSAPEPQRGPSKVPAAAGSSRASVERATAVAKPPLNAQSDSLAVKAPPSAPTGSATAERVARRATNTLRRKLVPSDAASVGAAAVSKSNASGQDTKAYPTRASARNAQVQVGSSLDLELGKLTLVDNVASVGK